MNKKRAALIAWVAGSLFCAIQNREGWYVKSCRELGLPARKRCYVCSKIDALERELS